jgi:hypothetical protein
VPGPGSRDLSAEPLARSDHIDRRTGRIGLANARPVARTVARLISVQSGIRSGRLRRTAVPRLSVRRARADHVGRTSHLGFRLLFGLFHVVIGSPASPERFLPSVFMGLLLGWLAWRSGSVLPGMLLHLLP